MRLPALMRASMTGVVAPCFRMPSLRVGEIQKYQYASAPPITTAKKITTPSVYDVLRRDAQDIGTVYSAEWRVNSEQKARPCGRAFWHSFEHSVLAPAYSPLASTIGSGRLNCRVRNENGCSPSDKAPTRNAQRDSVR